MLSRTLCATAYRIRLTSADSRILRKPRERAAENDFAKRRGRCGKKREEEERVGEKGGSRKEGKGEGGRPSQGGWRDVQGCEYGSGMRNYMYEIKRSIVG